MSSILLVIMKEKEILNKLTWGVRLSQAMGLPLKVVHPERYPKQQDPVPQVLEESCSQPILEAIRETLVKKKLDTPPTLHFLQGPDPLGQVLEFAKKEKTSLLLTGQHEIHNDSNRVLRKRRDGLLDRASCDVIVLRGENKPSPLKKILVPIAGGPHAAASLKLAIKMAQAEEGASVIAMHIEPEAGEEAEGVGNLVLERVLSQLTPGERASVKPKVVLADNVIDGIEQTVKEGEFNLVLLGASNTGFLHKNLFGNIPIQLLQRNIPGTIGVLHYSQPVAQKTADFFRYQFNRFLPQLKRDERVALFENLQSGSKLSIDFVALIGLSTIIAAFGLINNATAVVIGAMLVAPLMTPMIGTGLGLVQGNWLLVREAMRAIIWGFCLSLVLGFLCGLLGLLKFDSHPLLTAELLARCQLNMYDHLIAIFSGLAAAYALARPGLMAALPGVAIAAALVPPITTVGVALAWGYPAQAVQAALLFGLNLLSIIMASTFILFIFGIRARHKQPRLWARRLMTLLFLGTAIVAIPLVSALVAQVTPDKTIRETLQKHLNQVPYHSLENFQYFPKRNKRPDSAVITIYSTQPVSQKLVNGLTQLTRKYLRNPTLLVRIVALKTWEMNPRTKPPKPPNPPKPSKRAK